MPTRRHRPPLSRVFLLTLLCGLSSLFSLGFLQFWQPQAMATQPPVLVAATPTPATPTIGTVDLVPPLLQVNQQLYLQTCGSCHLAIPPQVLPSQTWQKIIQDSNHYGATLPPLLRTDLNRIWAYLRTYSRAVEEGTAIPYRVNRSRYFRILHPRVDFPQPVSLSSCVTCHPGAAQYNFRSLTPEWENAP